MVLNFALDLKIRKIITEDAIVDVPPLNRGTSAANFEQAIQIRILKFSNAHSNNILYSLQSKSLTVLRAESFDRSNGLSYIQTFCEQNEKS